MSEEADLVTVTVEVPGRPGAPQLRDLPRTGAELDVLVAAALALILLGALLLLAARTRLEIPHA